LLTHPALTHDFLLVSLKTNNDISGKASKEARRKSQFGEDLTPEQEHHVKRQVNVLCACKCVCVYCRFARLPKSAHLLTPPALTHDLLLVSLKTNNGISGKASKEERRKSRLGEVLTDEQSRYIVRYSHPTPCCSLARPLTSAH